MGHDDELIDAEQLVRELTLTELNESAEEYFAGQSDWRYLLGKPFSNMQDTPQLLAHLSALISVMDLEPDMIVLDFGAGSCWTSRMLAEMGLRVIALDVSGTALEIGRTLLQRQPLTSELGAITFLRFDGEHIELPSSSVDRIAVLDAFHHVPDRRQVLAEFRRVLRSSGKVVMSEPGPDHSRSPQSQLEMRLHRVLERDVHLDEIDLLSRSVGFATCSAGVYLPRPELVPSAMFQEALDSDQVAGSAAREYSRDNLLIVLEVGGPPLRTSRRADGLAAALEVTRTSSLTFAVRITNTGSTSWIVMPGAFGQVRLGVQLWSDDGSLIDLDYQRIDVVADADASAALIEAGEERTVTFTVHRPRNESCLLAFDLVAEHVCWFAQAGSLVTPMIRVEGRPRTVRDHVLPLRGLPGRAARRLGELRGRFRRRFGSHGSA